MGWQFYGLCAVVALLGLTTAVRGDARHRDRRSGESYTLMHEGNEVREFYVCFCSRCW
jgi:hypothetical protein